MVEPVWHGRTRRTRNDKQQKMTTMESRSAMMTRGETGSCCVRGGHGGSYLVPRVDVSTICDEYLCGLRVTITASIVEMGRSKKNSIETMAETDSRERHL